MRSQSINIKSGRACEYGNPARSRGSVLVITLIMLLLISILGVGGMQASRLQTKMANNSLQKQTSFNNAESTINFGESNWDQVVVTCLIDISNCEDDVLASLWPAQMDTVDGVPDIGSVVWHGEDAVAVEASVSGSLTYGLYTIEFIGQRSVPGDADKVIYVYRITARGEDSSGRSSSMVQTLYRRCIKIPDFVPCPA